MAAAVAIHDGPLYQSLIDKLHKCTDTCQRPCFIIEAAFTIIAIARTTVTKIAQQLNGPYWVSALELYTIVCQVVPELWLFYQLWQQPLRWGAYSVRNQIIQNALEIKVRDAFWIKYPLLPGGWQ
jgi:hypothetical protein